MNARSEFVCPMNFCEGLVSDSTRMFQVASPALNMPALSPTRGSGFGASTALLGATPVVALVDTERAQAVTASIAATAPTSLDEKAVTRFPRVWSGVALSLGFAHDFDNSRYNDY